MASDCGRRSREGKAETPLPCMRRQWIWNGLQPCNRCRGFEGVRVLPRKSLNRNSEAISTMSAEALSLPFDQTQEARILAHLESGKTITPLVALDLYGCFRLGARCWNLKEGEFDGVKHPIKSRMITLPNKKRVAEYYLERKSHD